MNIHGMLLVKNEADILEASLIAASKWCDFIYVYDNGSTDGGWEIAQALSRLYPQIIPFKEDGKPYTEGMRSEIFNHYFNRAQPGDWWAKVDADEFYIENPQTFLAKVPPQYKLVVSASLNYYFTDVDADRYSEEPARYADEVPVEEKIRYYLNHWSEARFMRHEPHLVWKDGTKGWPSPMGSTYPVRIMLKHFQYRSPQQIERRLRDRIAALAYFPHEAMKDWGQTVGTFRTKRHHGLSHCGKEYATTDWRTHIVPADKLDYDDHTGKYIINESLMPPIDMLDMPWTSRPIGTLPRLLPGMVSRKLMKAVRSVFPFPANLDHLTAKRLTR